MQYLLLLLPLLSHVTSTCNNTWQDTACCRACSCLSKYSSQSELYLSHPQLSHYTRGVMFYSGREELLLSLFIRRDATAADVKCVGEERSRLTEQQFDGPDTPSALETKQWRIHFQQDSVKIHDQTQGKVLTWNVRQLGCFNIVQHIRFVGFTNLHDGTMCYQHPVDNVISTPDDVTTELDVEIREEEEEEGVEVYDDTKDMHLMTNILIIAGVSFIVILICVVGLIRQCRECVSRMFCLDKCCRSSYHVSALEGRRMYNLESQAATHSTNASTGRSSSSSNVSSLLQY
ncbi:hypothetical protein ACHWQZ_G008305 [Mnemiopsis leidyi]